MTTSYEFRVQFVDDVDPFNVLASIKHAEPTVPKRFNFVSDLPLYDQVPGLKKHLRAPHKVHSFVCLCTYVCLHVLIVYCKLVKHFTCQVVHSATDRARL